jgi:VWFA-related protein
MKRLAFILILIPFAASNLLPQIARTRPRVRFQVTAELVLVDVRALDLKSHPVAGLKATDFEVLEDGVPQRIESFREVNISSDRPAQTAQSAPLVIPYRREDVEIPLEKVTQYRLWVVLFNFAGMDAEQMLSSTRSVKKFVAETMGADDLMAVFLYNGELRLISNLTNDRQSLSRELDKLDKEPPVSADTASADNADAGDPSSDEAGEPIADDQEFAMFDTNRQFIALQSVLQFYREVPTRKSLLYFSSGIRNQDADNYEELSRTTSIANRANASIYSVDARGLVALAPGGGARDRGPKGEGMFTAKKVNDQFANLAASQETLEALAKDTGGRALVDSNDFGKIFKQAQQDTSNYYLLGYYSSSSRKDGKFRKIEVRSRVPNLKVSFRKGYNGPKSYLTLTSEEKEEFLERAIISRQRPEQFGIDLRADSFYRAADQVLIPLSLKFFKKELLKEGERGQKLDLVGFAQDPQGEVVQTLRDSLEIKPGDTGTSILYQNAFLVKPGIYSLTFYARENLEGRVTSVEQTVKLPPRPAQLSTSSVVFGTQLIENSNPHFEITKAGAKHNEAITIESPLKIGNSEIVPSTDRVFARSKQFYVLFHAYNARLSEGKARVKVTASIQNSSGKTLGDAPSVSFQSIDNTTGGVPCHMRFPLSKLTPGKYLLKLEVLDEASSEKVRLEESFEVTA